MRKQKGNIILLDGDVLRTVFKLTDYSQEGRKRIGYQYSVLCKMLSEQGIDVSIWTVAMYDELRECVINYKEIYLKVAIEELV